MNMCLLEVAMCEKCRSSDFQLDEGRRVKILSTAEGGGLKNFRTGSRLPIWRGVLLLGDQYLITCNVTFIYLMTLFIVQNLKIIFTADAELWKCAIFGSNMDHLPQTNFFWKIIIILIYLLALFIVKNLKKLLPADPELWGCAILKPQNDPFPQIIIFSENLLMSLVSFIHAYLHAKN